MAAPLPLYANKNTLSLDSDVAVLEIAGLTWLYNN